MDGSYYIYALKDPRKSPAKPFYIGKGTGTRAWDHLTLADETRKGKRIQEIKKDGRDVIVSILSNNLSEVDAIKLEAELISAFGTEDSGGILTNSVIPSGIISKLPKNLNIPVGLREKAQIGLEMIKDAVIELAKANEAGITNAEVAKALGLQSDYRGGSKDYLSFSIIGILMKEGRIKREKGSRYSF
jgi:hypothetical protein